MYGMPLRLCQSSCLCLCLRYSEFVCTLVLALSFLSVCMDSVFVLVFLSDSTDS